MFKIVRQEITWGGRPLILETGKIARQADGAVVATYGETSVLCTVVGLKKVAEGADFFPLTVHYQEKAFAAGKIPGGFFKREGKPSETEVLNSRLIDRPIRPLFPENFFNEVQVVCTLLSHDLENDPAVLAIIGVSAALSLSGLPFSGPLGAARVAYKEGEYILNPSLEQIKSSSLDLVVAGTREGVMMVESEASELSEDVMLGAVSFGHQEMQAVIDMMGRLQAAAGKPAWTLQDDSHLTDKIYADVKKQAEEAILAAYQISQKQGRYQQLEDIRTRVLQTLSNEERSTFEISRQIKNLEKDIVRSQILKTKKRIDGRDIYTVRPIQAEVGFIPRTHGSALFTRGETQALVVATLGTTQDEQLIDALEGEYRESFLLHYNFPPYSVGETGRMSGPGRREIGHGKLAWRAIHPILPSKEAFPYTMRVVSEITESNGSSSMATVCGTSLALMDAGVPLKKPVAGIAMGLIKEKGDYVVLSDILGDEDHLGDMDFKVAGTDQGITALQMDIKVTGINQDIMKNALAQALQGRLHILQEMNKALEGAREDVSSHAPRIETITIRKEKIRDLIGTGGKVIRELCETTGAKIDISEDGVVQVSGANLQVIEAALERIVMITAEPEVGLVYKGVVGKVLEYGAIIEFLGSRSGLLHVSQIADQRVEKVEDVLKAGDTVFIKLAGFDDRGRLKLSMKGVNQQTGEETSATNEA